MRTVFCFRLMGKIYIFTVIELKKHRMSSIISRVTTTYVLMYNYYLNTTYYRYNISTSYVICVYVYCITYCTW